MEELKGKTAISIEDDPSISKMYATLLENLGIQTDIALDGAEGLEMLKKNYYDIVLLDLMMPKLSGFGVLEKITEEDVKCGKIIVLTNLTSQRDAEIAKSKGVSEYLLKAMYTPKQVGEVVKKHLTNQN